MLSTVQAVVLRGRGCCWLSAERGDVRRVNQVSALLDEADGLFVSENHFLHPLDSE